MLEKAQALQNELVRIRRDIHAHPELGFEEVRTSQLVADTLEEIGIKVTKGVGRTGVIGEIGTGDGPTLAIRADMDALPISEQTNTAYASQNPGIMHACGHDAHTAILLGVAHLLKGSLAEDNWHGNVRFLFQPSEEKFDDNGISGATAMIDDDALEGVDAVIALHVISNLEAGVCFFQDGPSMAAVDSFEGWIRGDGGHGAAPHEGTDPLFMLSNVLPTLYAIPSRRIDPLKQSVISVGQISGGSAENVIPKEVYVKGTIRSFDLETRHRLWAEIEKAFKISEVMGGNYKLTIHEGYPMTVNHPEANNWMRQVAADLLGPTAVKDHAFGMGAEDFAYMTQKAKGAMFLLGAAIDDGIMRNHHTDIFDIDEAVMPRGAAVLAETARRFVTGKL
ncbi:MAG TPA: amidohydrolase [Anaerolineae bacterium]|nr:amidohydrolase [Anaerolineae bacterium]